MTVSTAWQPYGRILISPMRLPLLLFTLLQATPSNAQSPTSRPNMPPVLYGSQSEPNSSSPSSSAPSSTSSPDDSVGSSHSAFNYFFLLIGGVGVLLFGMFLYWSARRRRRRSQSQASGRVALARDIEAWGRTGIRYGGVRVHPTDNGAVHRHEEGVDERGEAPPSYETAAKDKPPSLRHVELQTRGSVDSGPRTTSPTALATPTTTTNASPTAATSLTRTAVAAVANAPEARQSTAQPGDASPGAVELRSLPPGYRHAGSMADTRDEELENVDLEDMTRPTALRLAADRTGTGTGGTDGSGDLGQNGRERGGSWRGVTRYMGGGITNGFIKS